MSHLSNAIVWKIWLAKILVGEHSPGKRECLCIFIYVKFLASFYKLPIHKVFPPPTTPPLPQMCVWIEWSGPSVCTWHCSRPKKTKEMYSLPTAVTQARAMQMVVSFTMTAATPLLFSHPLLSLFLSFARSHRHRGQEIPRQDWGLQLSFCCLGAVMQSPLRRPFFHFSLLCWRERAKTWQAAGSWSAITHVPVASGCWCGGGGRGGGRSCCKKQRPKQCQLCCVRVAP